MVKRSSLKINFIMNALLTISSLLFPLITFPYISRILLPIGTGKVSLATSIISYFTLFSQLGIPTYGIRACAKVREDKEELSKLIQELLIIGLCTSVLSYISFFIVINCIPKIYEEKLLYCIMSTSIILGTIGIEWFYKGLEEYKYITIRSIIFKFIALISMFILVKQKQDYIIYGGISIFAASASNILNLINARKYVFHKTKTRYNFKRHIKPILIFFAMSCATTIYTHLDVTMLGFIKSDVDVGYYNAAIKMKQFLVGIITSLGAVLLPRSSSYIDKGENNKFEIISIKAFKFVLLISIPLMFYFSIFAKESIYFLSGKEYSESILPMQILMPTLVIISMSNIIGIQMLIPLNKEKYVLYSEIIGTVVNIVLNSILIPYTASVGATIGTVVAEICVLLYQFKIILKIIPGFKVFNNIKKYLLAALISSIISYFVKIAVSSDILILLISACIFFIIYFILLVTFKDDLIDELFLSLKSIVKGEGKK